MTPYPLFNINADEHLNKPKRIEAENSFAIAHNKLAYFADEQDYEMFRKISDCFRKRKYFRSRFVSDKRVEKEAAPIVSQSAVLCILAQDLAALVYRYTRGRAHMVVYSIRKRLALCILAQRVIHADAHIYPSASRVREYLVR